MSFIKSTIAAAAISAVALMVQGEARATQSMHRPQGSCVAGKTHSVACRRQARLDPRRAARARGSYAAVIGRSTAPGFAVAPPHADFGYGIGDNSRNMTWSQ